MIQDAEKMSYSILDKIKNKELTSEEVTENVYEFKRKIEFRRLILKIYEIFAIFMGIVFVVIGIFSKIIFISIFGAISSLISVIINETAYKKRINKQIDDFKLLIQQNYPDVYNQNVLRTSTAWWDATRYRSSQYIHCT